MNNQLSGLILKCDSLSEFKNLMKHKRIVREHSFFDKTIKIKRSPSRFVDFSTELKSDILDSALRMFLYLKFNGFTAFEPQNSGEHSLSCSVKANFLNLEKVLKKSLSSLDDIEIEDIKSAFKHYLQNSNLTRKKTFIIHVNRIRDYIKHEELYPNFLRFNIFVKRYILNEEYLEIWDMYSNPVDCLDSELTDEAKVIKKNLKEAGLFSDRGMYPIEDMCRIIRTSKEYIENYTDECLEILNVIVESRQQSTSMQKAKYIYNYFKRCSQENRIFKNALLNKYQRLTATKPLYIYKKRKYAGVGAKIEFSDLIHMVDLLEASCISIILLGTAMRVGELLELKREFTLLDSTFPQLVRVIFKTSNSQNGDVYNNPIPKICINCLEILSQITELKDYKNEYDGILVSSIYSSNAKLCDGGRINMLINKISSYAGIKEAPTNHQFRHSMAYLVASSDSKDGLELASLLLGHKNIPMTIRYLSMFNVDIYNAKVELDQLNSEKLIDIIVESASKDEKLFGEKAKYFNPNVTFVGKQAEEFSLSLKRNLRKLVEEAKFAIIQTTHCMCIHDLSKPKDMKCHLGYDFSDEIGGFPLTNKCKSAECKNAIFTESDVEKLKELYGHIEYSEIRERLEKNTYFLKLGGFSELNPFAKLINEYDKYKEEKEQAYGKAE